MRKKCKCVGTQCCDICTYSDKAKKDRNLKDKIKKFVIKDSGTRQEFPTGARRDIQENKGRYDLLPCYAMARLAKHYESGAKKYGENNWTKGMPLNRYLDSALRHLFKFMDGERDEDHAIASAWNIMCLIETEHMIEKGILPSELNTLKNPVIIPQLK